MRRLLTMLLLAAFVFSIVPDANAGAKRAKKAGSAKKAKKAKSSKPKKFLFFNW